MALFNNVNTVNVNEHLLEANNNCNDNLTLNVMNICALPIAPAVMSPAPPFAILNSPNVVQIELDQKTKQIQLLDTAYWSLKADFDKVCGVLQSMEIESKVNNTANANLKTKPKPKPKLNTKPQLTTIEEEADDVMIEKMEEIESLRVRNRELQNEVKELKQKNCKIREDFKLKNRETNRKNNWLEKEVKNLKHKIKRIEKENRKLANFHLIEQNKRNVKQNTLKELYLNPNRIKEFMSGIKHYGSRYEILKRRQINLTKCVGKEDNEIFKIRMNDLYHDIIDTEQAYRKLYEALDVMKTESEGKELELITRDKEYILLLEKEKLIASSHLEEYVKKNQTLQTNLTDREMKLRQTQNEVAFVKQKLNCLQESNDTLLQQLNIYNVNNVYYTPAQHY